MSCNNVLDTQETQLSSLSVTDLSQILSKLHSAKALAMVACTSKLFQAATHLAFRDLCNSSGRSLQTHRKPGHADATDGCNPQICQLPPEVDSTRKQPAVNWRSIFFQQSYALSFNGINEYVSLPAGCLNWCHSGRPDSDGLTIDIMMLAHTIPACPPPVASTKPCKAVIPPAGGMLFSCQDREFGRSRRAARLESMALLYIGTDGYLYSELGPMKSSHCLADDQWHRVTLTMRWTSPTRLDAVLYIDGCMDAWADYMCCANLPHYPVLGSGVTEGSISGCCAPVYNCHSFHGMIDELRLWARPLSKHEVQELAFQRFQRIAGKHDMPYAQHLVASWSLTEGSGCVLNNHIVSAGQTVCTAQLGAVAIPSAHHTYSTVSKMVASIPEQALKSKGPKWVVSTAPVEGELIMEFCDQKVR